jgi:hypothetical protein
MVAKRVSPGKKTAKEKAPPAAKLEPGAATETSSSSRSANLGSASIDPEARRQLVAAEAYFLAERRGFSGGNALEDWVAAERVVDSRLKQKQVA